MKRTLKKIAAVALAFAMVVPAVAGAPEADAAAKKVKLSASKATLAGGKKKAVTITGTKKANVNKLTVKSSDTKVATVKKNSNVKFTVTAKKISAKKTATITAKVTLKKAVAKKKSYTLKFKANVKATAAKEPQVVEGVYDSAALDGVGGFLLTNDAGFDIPYPGETDDAGYTTWMGDDLITKVGAVYSESYYQEVVSCITLYPDKKAILFTVDNGALRTDDKYSVEIYGSEGNTNPVTYKAENITVENLPLALDQEYDLFRGKTPYTDANGHVILTALLNQKAENVTAPSATESTEFIKVWDKTSASKIVTVQRTDDESMTAVPVEKLTYTLGDGVIEIDTGVSSLPGQMYRLSFDGFYAASDATKTATTDLHCNNTVTDHTRNVTISEVCWESLTDDTSELTIKLTDKDGLNLVDPGFEPSDKNFSVYATVEDNTGTKAEIQNIVVKENEDSSATVTIDLGKVETSKANKYTVTFTPKFFYDYGAKLIFNVASYTVDVSTKKA